MKYIALLRGVNVGGKNKVSMKHLKESVEQNGFSHVSTYINSGNIIFSHDNEDAASLQQEIKQIIIDAFDIDVPVAVITAEELQDALSHSPEWWDDDTESKHNAIFVIAPAKSEHVIELVGEAKPEYEKIDYRGPVIFWSAPLKTFSRTRWSKVVATKAYASITIRNANTAKKLLEMVL